MADKLIIVESPAKANTIKKFLGGKTKVVASMGHIRDLPKSKLGVNIENNFEPEYINIRGKGDLIKSLKKDAKSAKKVYLATDPDREGEAIAWHLAHILDIPEDSKSRVTFNEITKTAVQKAIKEPRQIDINLVNAQQARRVLDRIVGYKISPVLWKKVRKGLSAGRVQSVAVKLIVDREKEIEDFIPEEYWNIIAKLLDEKSKKEFEAKLVGKNNKKLEIHSKEEVDEILANIKDAKFIVKDVKKGERKRNPAPPFTTSTMQQEASRKLNFSLKKTMSVAQTLYEGVKIPEKGTVGLITYMRTDSTRISEEARKVAKEVVEATYGSEYYENRYYKTKADAQDAHEAIRPTYIDIKPEQIKDSLTNDQYKLYRLIYNRFLASQMKSAIFDTLAVTIDANEYNFKANGQSIKFKGFMTLYVEGTDEKEDEIGQIPLLEVAQEVKKEKIESKQSFTEPPPRYTEASLVKALEEKDIGRPSTYSPTITTILARHYIEKEAKQLVPTELGKVVNKLLTENFPDIINVEFTAEIENEFDEIADGKENWKQMISEFYGPFEKELEKVEKELEHVELEEEVSDVPCEKCGRMMVVKYGRYGKFLACPGYPECKNVKPYIETIEEPCPKCGGKVQIRKTKNRRTFYICENNPDKCDYISWTKPKKAEK
ncbi:dNA topoisomerase [Clostridium sp. CAG:354]|jgi:DNA topoisomerase I|uniref:type I DNA topoisomerase n=1 Tax=Candidatus Merdicola sp. TaxID=3085652 RepID=UPI000336BAA0|nr:type I DNA topoisomerase [Clostridium sp.]MEE0268284.1 type I DNA topoisomerase [Clostridia bacterium]CDE10463.1 dNA topoisomerase [Clostridium sp. CAG:354]